MITQTKKLSKIMSSPSITPILDSVKKNYKNKVEPTLRTVLQFAMWYLLFHTLYWITEQLRFTWCVPCGLSGYIHTLIVSQSLVCRLLTSISKHMSDQQISSITLLTSFVGIKLISYTSSKETDDNTSNNKKSKSPHQPHHPPQPVQNTQHVKETTESLSDIENEISM